MLGMFARILAIALLFAWGVPLSQAATPSPKEDRLTADNYGKIQNGMTTAEVKEILGPPQLTVTSGSNHDSSMEWRTKTPPVHKIEVQFREGLVVSKSTNIALAPPATRPAPPVRVEKTAEDKFDAALANLSSPDVSKHARAIEFFEDAPLNPARADEVSRLLVKSLSAKDPRITMTAEQAIRKWATKESADYFLKIIDHPQLEHNGMEKHTGQTALALDILARLKEPAAVPGMVKMLKHFFNRSDAVAALKRMGPELAEKELQKSANDPNGPVRQAVEEILQEFRDGGPEPGGLPQGPQVPQVGIAPGGGTEDWQDVRPSASPGEHRQGAGGGARRRQRQRRAGRRACAGTMGCGRERGGADQGPGPRVSGRPAGGRPIPARHRHAQGAARARTA